MEVLLTAAVVLLLCWLLDKVFTKYFRGTAQHRSGRSVRLSKRNGGFGTALFVIGISCLFTGLTGGLILVVGGIVMMAVGVALVVYYMTFGIYYDDDSFLYASFGKKGKTYSFGQIRGQQLYANGGQVIIELYMDDGSAVLLQSSMTDVYSFLDHAFYAWCRQTGREPEACPFHDPANSCWFPKTEEQ